MKSYHRIVLTFFAFLFITLESGSSQQITFKHYGVNEGISQSMIKCIYQDTEGFLWLGTQNGLNKFDGISFKNFFYDPTDRYSLSNNWIFSICEDSLGNLWMGTKEGLNKYNKRTGKFTVVPHKTDDLQVPDDFVYGLTSDSTYIYINIPPLLSRYNYRTDSLESYSNSQDYDGLLRDIGYPVLRCRHGKIWLGSSDGLSMFDPETKTFENFRQNMADPQSLPSNHITALYEDRNGYLFVGTENGLIIYDPQKNRFTPIQDEVRQQNNLSRQYIRSIIQDSQGRYWIGTQEGGLKRLEYKQNSKSYSLMTFQSGPDENYLAHDNVNSLLEDHSQNLWIGTIDGLNCTDLKTKKFRNFKKTDDPNSIDLLDNIIASVHIDEQDRIWIGNWGKGLNIFDPANGNMLHYTTEANGNKYIPNNYVHVLFKDSHARLWLGTRNGVCIYNQQEQTFTPWFNHFNFPDNDFFVNNRVYCITEVSNGEIWFGTGNGIMTFHPVTKETNFFRTGAPDPNHINSNLVYSILEDKDGLIWIATMDGLSCFLPKQNRIKHYTHDPEQPNSLCDDFTISLCEDHRGNIWIGTSTGVNQFNKEDSTFTYFSIKDGLPSNIVYDIIEDKNQDLWFSTGSGLARRRGSEFKSFSVNEGLQGVEFNLKAVFQDDNGDLYFGGMNGLHAFHPDSLEDNTFIPPVVITSFLKENDGKKENLNVYTNKLELSYKDYSFTISYAALDFTQPSKNRYAYMMEGLRDEWEEVGNRPFVHFTNLPSGNYTFLVKGTNNDGVWNEEPTRLHIRIHPPWWRSHYAYGAYILVSFLLIIGVIGLRERNLQREKRHLEAGIQERTAEIAKQKEELNDLNASKDKFFSILAHDLKNPFSSLYSMSQVLDQNYENLDKEDKLTAIKRIHQSAELIYNLLENLLTWSKSQSGRIEYAPSAFDLSVLVQENINLHSMPAEKKGIRLTGMLPDIHEVYADRQMINTVLRNLINNAIKFTKPGKEVTVSVRPMGKFLEVEIKDQGIGISSENLEKLFRIDVKYKTTGTSGEKGTGLGLILCHEFIHKNRGTIWCQSEEGEGSSFFFTVPAEKPDNL